MEFLECSANTPAYRSIAASPLLLETPPASIQPISLFRIDALARETEKHLARHPRSSQAIHIRNTTTSVVNSPSDHLVLVAWPSNVWDHILA